MKPVIFLDFDGVLNSTSSMLALKHPAGDMQPLSNPIAVGLMSRLCVEADAKVVVSSAWRIGSSVESLQSVLRRWGGWEIATRVISTTPVGGNQRGEQIERWLAEHPGNDNYVIVDDDDDMLDTQQDRFVQVRHRDGFTVPDYLKALRVIAPEHKDLVQLGWYEQNRPLSSEKRRQARTDQ